MTQEEADEEYVRRAIHARGNSAFTGAILHGVLALIALVLLANGGEPLPFALAGGGLGSVAIWLGVASYRRRDGRSGPLRALLKEPGTVDQITIVDEEAGLQVQITARGATDYVCPPHDLDDLLAMLRRRCPGAAVTDRR